MKVDLPPSSLSDSVELVLTIPGQLGVDPGTGFHARSTLGVIVELISQADEQVVMGAPYVQEHEALLRGPLGNAVGAALDRGVEFHLITADATLLHETFHELKDKHDHSIHILHPTPNGNDRVPFFTHAKFCVSDLRAAYIGSANLTGKGISANLEMGLLVHGSIVKEVLHVFDFLLRAGYLSEVLT